VWKNSSTDVHSRCSDADAAFILRNRHDKSGNGHFPPGRFNPGRFLLDIFPPPGHLPDRFRRPVKRHGIMCLVYANLVRKRLSCNLCCSTCKPTCKSRRGMSYTQQVIAARGTVATRSSQTHYATHNRRRSYSAAKVARMNVPIISLKIVSRTKHKNHKNTVSIVSPKVSCQAKNAADFYFQSELRPDPYGEPTTFSTSPSRLRNGYTLPITRSMSVAPWPSGPSQKSPNIDDGSKPLNLWKKFLHLSHFYFFLFIPLISSQFVVFLPNSFP